MLACKLTKVSKSILCCEKKANIILEIYPVQYAKSMLIVGFMFSIFKENRHTTAFFTVNSEHDYSDSSSITISTAGTKEGSCLQWQRQLIWALLILPFVYYSLSWSLTYWQKNFRTSRSKVCNFEILLNVWKNAKLAAANESIVSYKCLILKSCFPNFPLFRISHHCFLKIDFMSFLEIILCQISTFWKLISQSIEKHFDSLGHAAFVSCKNKIETGWC